MATVSGIFASFADAERAMESMKAQGFTESQINLLARGESSFPVHGKQLGAAVGGYLGLSAVTFLPGLGPVIGLGMLASGLIGAVLGSAVGSAVERHTHGVPNEDIYFFEEAVRDGGAVLIVEPKDSVQETKARNLIERGGGRPPGAARRDWWQSLRDRERDYVRAHGREFEKVEGDYRSGFEAALHPSSRGRSYEQCVAYLETCYPEPCRTDVFRIGFDRGQEYFRDRMRSREVT